MVSLDKKAAAPSDAIVTQQWFDQDIFKSVGDIDEEEEEGAAR